ncbi:hypothetical protein MMYC01_208745 [Madurella mycetomatis]|uniref:NACHT-NTPase and P-loop NTPases N-terminal domain-containing protein n=1 Tax=Madurella mycetomatis TaxID=100816 RepID=A0A175VS50_9PEZI|nr:hypothetical protein MMYC01_210084 [Madurella mycetomatis]KXX75173.1 hypothetical protein MMYC01_208745 [Madurella mycetomatis]
MEPAASIPPQKARGADLVGVLSDTIAILEAATGHHTTIHNDKSLPEVFHKAAHGLFRVSELLQLIETHPQDALDASESCNKKARLSEEMFREVSQAPETLRFQYYRAAVRRRGRESMVEVLASGMMDDVCSLAGDGALNEVTKSQAEGLRALIEELAAMEPSVPDDRARYTFANYGPGNQFNAPGGTQNNNMGSGNQFPGATFSGAVHFGSGSC